MSYDHLSPSLLKAAPSALALPGEPAPVRAVVEEAPRRQVPSKVPSKSEREDLLARRESILKRRAVGHNNPMARVLGYAAARRQTRAF